MSTPPEVRRLIDALADDIYDAYYGIEYRGPQYSRGQGMQAARYLARKLIRRGWRKTADYCLPRCPHGTPTCYDPAPHDHCEL
ncbi:hypothetical protein B1987_22805 [Mycobacterium kansasii]|uniref:Uncharacterized protein n=1 Tax=Mycobacterium attenuatum TaxID=2341086 RepID=A0A498PUR4_9MYCO|nr:hypothetical protein B1987_22805 [Mycobacterium kansasii]VBA36691.1 hypothetical protein LAUMK136_01533 [Mycobacterium attenuatum]VBA49276.1 hypothetical protein LAUMK191_01525 [Mycobacterium attenuatum]VBA54885.1 hypothetical protein LAUMK41_01597 [Mycobacterium attenuatum]